MKPEMPGQQLSREILAKLRANKSFKQNRCPTSWHYPTEKEDWQRNELPEGGCNCDDVVYTGGEWSGDHTFMYSSIIIANTYTKCFKWEREYGTWFYNPAIVRSNNYSYRQVDRHVPAKELREKLKMAAHREAYMLAHADHELKKTYNQGYVNIRGVPFSVSRLRKALMYQDTQEFDLTVITYHDNVPLYNREGCPMLHLRGGSHHIVVFGQHPQETAKFVGMTSIGYDAFE